MKFSIKDLFSNCDQIRSFQQVCSNLLKKSLMENFIIVQWLFNERTSKTSSLLPSKHSSLIQRWYMLK